MPYIWNQSNLLQNLVTLTGLKSGDKFSIDSTGKFHVQKEGLFQGLKRTFTGGASLTDKDQFEMPLYDFFDHATTAFLLGKIQMHTLNQAVAGLKKLQGTYQKSDKNHLDALTRILDSVDNILVEGVRPSLPLLPKNRQTFDLLTHDVANSVRKQILAFFDISSNNSLLNNEQTGNTSDIKAIFGTTGKSSAKATMLGSSGMSYQRTSLGVCQQFYKDAILRNCSIRLESNSSNRRGNTNLVTKSILTTNHLQALFQFLNQDEALFFITSQLFNQAGLGSLGMLTLQSLPCKVSRVRAMPIQPNDVAYALSWEGSGVYTASCTQSFNNVKCIVEYYAAPSTVIPKETYTLKDLGIKSIKHRCEVKFSRVSETLITGKPTELMVEIETA